MRVDDGFIEGIDQYCDRWCERCALTSRCEAFAFRARFEASRDPALAEVVLAPPLPEEVPAPPHPDVLALMREVDEATRSMTPEERDALRPRLPPAHQEIDARGRAYAVATLRWLGDRSFDSTEDEAATIVGHHAGLIGAKIHRALEGLADTVDDPDWPPDCHGSAKVALLAIERSHAAWLVLAETGRANAAEAHARIADLVWLGERIEEVFPHARSFIRPGFDEPDDVARLDAEE